MKGDFLVVSGDVVSNVELGPALAGHKARREKDKNAIMTMVLREKPSRSVTSSRRRKPVFVLNPRIHRCLHYEEVGGKGAERYITLDPEFVTTNDEIEITENLSDPHIDICTPDVLALWSDNFDYQSLRKSFLFGVLKDHELNGKTIHTHIIRDQYAARVATLKAYSAITRHILERRAFPFDPESNILEDQSYQSLGADQYREDAVVVARNAKVAGRSIIGRGTKIGDKSTVLDTSIGRNCHVGINVHLENVQIWDNVTIEDHTKITGPVIIADNVHVGAETTIHPGSVIASDAKITKGATISGIKIFRKEADPQTKLELSDDSDASSQASLQLYSQGPSISSSQSSLSTFASSENLGSDPGISRRSSVISDRSDDAASNKDFLVEATANIFDGISKDDSPDAIFLELNSYRMSVNASQHQVRHAVVAACVKRVVQLSDGKSAKDAVQTVLEKYVPLLERMLFDKDAEEKADQLDLLLLAQKEVVGKEKGDQLLLFMAQQLYELDVVEEDGVLQWWEDPKSQTGELSEVRGLTQQFITWLQEAEETEGSEDENS